MNADVTPMNADEIVVDVASSNAIGIAAIHVPRSSTMTLSAFIGVTSAFIGVSKDFRLS